jgi:radical SAM superfamily enzyme YgiQ (UPF0313 family)
MKILFIYHNIDTKNIRHFPYGIGTLSACLKEQGHETELLYIQDSISEDELLAAVGSFGPDLIGFSTVTLQWQYTQNYARIIKSRFTTPIICGGPHATFIPEEVIAEPAVDMLCRGEGEYALLELLRRMASGGDLSTIPNLWSKNGQGGVFRNEIGPLVEDLDSLPFPDRSIIRYDELLKESKSEPIFITSRGCPYNCRFCSNSAIKKLYRGKGRYERQRSPENVIREIRQLRAQFEFSTMNFYDEAFGVNKQWLQEFLEMYTAEFSYPFGCFIRAETMDRERFRMMRKAGLSLIYLGVESGNDEIRRKVMGRKVSNERIIQACRDAQAEGIQVWTFNIVGVPGETEQTIDDTMELNRIINPHFVSISLYQPFPFTGIYDDCVEQGLIKNSYASSLYDNSVLELPTISREKLSAKFREFQELSTEIRLRHESNGERITLVDI